MIAAWFAHTQKCQELSREKRYQKAEQALRSCSFMLTKSSRKFPAIAYMTRGNYARACLKASQFIDICCIEKQLKSECHTGKNSHRCLDMFRDCAIHRQELQGLVGKPSPRDTAGVPLQARSGSLDLHDVCMMFA